MLDTYGRIEKAIHYLDEHRAEQPRLGEAARVAGLSEFHFQRVFRQGVGVSPKRFLQFLTADFAGELLRERRASVLDAAYEAGLSGPGRLHDLMVAVHAVTPGEMKRRCAGVVIRYGIHAGPFGRCLVAITGRGICALAFVQDSEREAVARLRERFGGARLTASDKETRPWARNAFRSHRAPLELWGTNFQLKVWEALLRIPAGSVACYEDVASAIGAPRATRAVASAVAANPVAMLIPCHRVILKTGAFGGYRWGTARKRALLAREAAAHPADDGF